MSYGRHDLSLRCREMMWLSVELLVYVFCIRVNMTLMLMMLVKVVYLYTSIMMYLLKW
jgi:hypothetical protein